MTKAPALTRRLLGLACSLVMLCTLAIAMPAAAEAAARAVPVKLSLTRAVSQTSANSITTTVKLVAKASSHRGATVRITVSVNPTGAGRTVTKSVTAHWSAGAYRATTKIVTAGPGKVAASVRVAGKTSKASAAALAATSKITGWASSTTVNAGTSVSDSITIAPAYGRTLQLQRWTGSRWAIASTVHLPKTAKATITVRPTSASGTTKWRAVVAATTRAKAATTATRTITARAKTSLSGWVTGSTTVSASSTQSVAVTIAPAGGRHIQVQQLKGSTWTTVATLTAGSGASSTLQVAITAPAQGSANWRLVAPTSGTGQALTTGTRTLVAEVSTAPVDPDPTPTVTPTPDPSVWTGPGAGGADCNAFTAEGTAFSCTTPAISNVAGRAYVDSRCGVTFTCLRAPLDNIESSCATPLDDIDAVLKSDPWYLEWFCGRSSWTPTPDYVDGQQATASAGGAAPYFENSETLYLPDLLDEFNTCREQGCKDAYGAAWAPRGVLPLLPMPGVSSSVSVTAPDGSTQQLVVPGQGGHAQDWADHIAAVCHESGICWGSWVHGGWNEIPVASDSDQGAYGARGKARAEAAVNDAAAPTAPPAGKRWQFVGEIYAAADAAPHTLVLSWMASSGHRGAIMQGNYALDGSEQQEYVMFGADVDPSGRTYAFAQFYVLVDA